MAVKIDRFRIVNKQRGNAKILAIFTVQIGPLQINGVELIQAGRTKFVAFPNRRYNAGSQKRPEWKTFNYIWFDGSKGEALKKDIEQAALEELERRGGGADDNDDRYSKKKSYRSRLYEEEDDDMPF